MKYTEFAILAVGVTVPFMTGCQTGAEPSKVRSHPDIVSKITMGDGAVNGLDIKPYDLSWIQCNFQDEAWVTAAPFHESISMTGPDTLSLVQSTQGGEGRTSKATYKLSRASLARMAMTRKIGDGQGNILAEISTSYTPEGYTTVTKVGDKTKTITGSLTSNMFDGMILGLPLSVLDYSKGDYTLEAAMLQFDGTYSLETVFAGYKMVNIDGQDIEAEMIDVKWLHHESGDIYPPGPEASGGQYWVVKNPPKNIPHVLRYKTDTYAIEFTPATCAP